MGSICLRVGRDSISRFGAARAGSVNEICNRQFHPLVSSGLPSLPHICRARLALVVMSEQAATVKLQAVQRGRSTRAKQANEARAATKMQAVHRGRDGRANATSMRLQAASEQPPTLRAQLSNREEASIFVRRFIMFFVEVDQEDKKLITFEQFRDALPQAIRDQHSAASQQSWFELMDHDGDGTVTIEEFVECSIAMAAIMSGAGILEIFEKYDHEKTGKLGEREYTFAARDLGFGEHAHALFQRLPLHSDNTVDYVDLLDYGRLSKEDKNTVRKFLKAMSWDTLEVDHLHTVDTTIWNWSAEDKESTRKALRALLDEHKVKLSEIFETIDTSDDNRISHAEFVDSFYTLLGFHGPREVLDDIFASLDDNGGGDLTFDELNAWVKGTSMTTRAKVEAATKLFLDSSRVKADEAAWDTNRLREEVHRLLDQADLQLTHLFDAWDDDGNGQLRKKEWLVHFKKLTRGTIQEELWYSKVRNSVTNAFMEIDKDGRGALDLQEMALWLHPTEPSPQFEGPPGAPARQPTVRVPAPSGSSTHVATRSAHGATSLAALLPVSSLPALPANASGKQKQENDIRFLTQQYTSGAAIRASAKAGSRPQKHEPTATRSRSEPTMKVKRRKAGSSTKLPPISKQLVTATTHAEESLGDGAEQPRVSPNRLPHHTPFLHDRYQAFCIRRSFEIRALARNIRVST